MLRRALFYTPAVREEFILRNASAWPATFDHKHNGCFNNVFSRSSTEDIPRGAVIPRGFKTRASHLGKPFTNCNSTSTGKVNAPRITLMPDGTPILPIPMLSREEEIRLRAFADGFSEGKSKSQSSWGVVSLLRDSLVLGVFTAAALYFLNGTRFSTVVMGTKNEVRSTEIDVKFDDVIGVETAKQELQEIVEFLKNPEKFSHLGGRLPKGVLLMGPPGTGKTLLARAVAGEAGVPFFHAAGPEFDEMLIGQGARRMRDLFQAAKAKAPCVIFIDEIDSVGSARSSSVLHPHANQTINQLLTEMDGFRQNEGVIVLGATNRRDDLDPALLRPGRFDIEVQVPKPDFNGRKSLLEYYTSKVKIDKNVDVEYLARGTTGFTGADIENMVNQAALRAAIVGEDSVTQSYLEYARDKVLMGPETKNRIPDHQDNLITAYHEAGHALVAYHSEGNMSLHKVTILARGSALGHTSFIPIKDDCHCTKSEILAKIDSALGGKAAEELVFGPENVTTGATADLKYATDLATHMVKSWGMSDKVGDRYFKTQTDALARANDISNEMSELIDEEVKRFLKEAKERALRILTTRRAQLNLLAEALMKYETLDSKDVRELLETGSLKR